MTANQNYELYIPVFDVFAHLRQESMVLVAETLDEKVCRKVFSDQSAIFDVNNVMIEQWKKSGASTIYKVLRKRCVERKLAARRNSSQPK